MVFGDMEFFPLPRAEYSHDRWLISCNEFIVVQVDHVADGWPTGCVELMHHFKLTIEMIKHDVDLRQSLDQTHLGMSSI